MGLPLFLCAQEEQGNCAWAGMGADHRANIIYDKVSNAKTLLYQFLHILGVLQAISMADKNHIVLFRQESYFHLLNQGFEGAPAALHLGNRR